LATQTATSDDRPLRGPDDLLEPFTAACKPQAEFRVGTEAEKHGVLAENGAALPFSGPRSVQAVMRHLQERFGWQPEREYADGEVIALRRRDLAGQDASITLEPAGQLELSGAPQRSIHDTCREFRTHLDEIEGVSRELGIVWLGLGFHPFATQAELTHVPKMRYGIMERYLPTRGSRALDMMRRTCTVQSNHDFSSEADAMRKLRVSLALQPIASAIFANSPFYERTISKRVSERIDVWLHMDPDRSGLLPFAWEHTASFRSYIEWALDVPMFMVKRGAHMIPNTTQTFRTFMREGRDGEHATLGDWKTHLNTLFPEVRLKNTLEMRGADTQSRDLTCALPALWKGIVDEPRALDQAERLIAPLELRDVEAARPAIAEQGLSAMLLGKPVQAWASELLDIATGGLERLDIRNERGENEAVHLVRLRRLVAAGKTPAQDVLDRMDRSLPTFEAQVMQAARLF
jgi:glutamate--cysteine ligase